MKSTAVYLLKTKLCVASSRGFDIVDLENLVTLSFLDPADPALKFMIDEPVKPLAMYRIEEEFLLCYESKFILLQF